MESAGFRNLRLGVFERFSDHKVGRAVLEDPFLQKSQTSQLALLSDEAYAAGINKIKKALDTHAVNNEILIFPVEIDVEMFVGEKPSD